MSDTQLRPDEVRDFVEQVRRHLRDLSDDERDELTEGLEADLAERVADRGSADLGEPADYAAELRAAAGLVDRNRRRFPRPSSTGVAMLLDRSHERWDMLVAAVPGDAAGLLATLQPVWWVLRAWVAVQMLDFWFGGYPHDWIPSMFGPVGWALTLLAVVASVQLGRGVLPLGRLRGTPRRVLLLSLNVVAVVSVAPMVSTMPTGHDTSGEPVYVVPHLAFNGNQVQNVYPYDAAGQPLTGVQLVDQDGQRLSVAGSMCQQYWTNGTKKVYSAFPVPDRNVGNSGTCTGPTTIAFPLASLPPVTLPASLAATAGTTP